MKINLDDPRITAFALGELTGSDAVELARAVRTDQRVGRAVDEVRSTAVLLGETLSPDGSEMLTSAQRHAIRSACASPVITDIASARNSTWKKISLAALGAAAAVVAGLWLAGDHTVSNTDGEVVEGSGAIRWDQIDTGMLSAPISREWSEPDSATEVTGAAAEVTTAVSDDTASFREELTRRVKAGSMAAVSNLPVLQAAHWHDPASRSRLRVPLSSGAASWPWLERFIMEEGELPPARVIRIEEMINHFSYQKPSSLVHAGVQADMEVCQTPWNNSTYLLAVHIKSLPGAKNNDVTVELVMDPEWVDKVRVLGYADAIYPTEKIISQGNPNIISKTQGNYVIYEMILKQNDDLEDFSAASLSVNGERLVVKSPIPWSDASADLRFASCIAAVAMMLSDYPERGNLSGELLLELIAAASQPQPNSTQSADRAQAIKLLEKAVKLKSARN